MQKNKIIVSLVFVVLSAAVLMSGGAFLWMYGKVRAYDEKHGSRVLENLNAREIFAMTNDIPALPPGGVSRKNKMEDGTKEPSKLEIIEVQYGGEDLINILFTRMPDFDVMRNYMKITPHTNGVFSVGYDVVKSKKTGKYEYCITVRADFEFRKDIEVRILKGLPLKEKDGADANVVLEKDFLFKIRRNDIKPYVNFADKGRYLPPAGRRSIAIKSVNTTNVYTEIRRLEPRNIVQMLAREEGAYSHCFSADSARTCELTGAETTNIIRCVNRANESEKNELEITMDDGKSRNGVFLVAARIADIPKTLWHEWWDDSNPSRYRLVCVSDLGLSVRRWDEDSLGVWVTSLTEGTPVAGTKIDVYSTANIKIMEGVTDKNGWCDLKRTEKGEPFAVVAVSPDGGDMTFLALRDSMKVDETYEDGAREEYLKPEQPCAFVWTERGIYRHNEKIFIHALFRNGKRVAPKPFPVEVALISPAGKTCASETVVTDEKGALYFDGFSVPDDQPSGIWNVRLALPGSKGQTVFGERQVKIEEFAPPQIRVKVEEVVESKLDDFAFDVKAEYLFGESAHNLLCQGAIVFEDIPFAPAGWKGWSFGNEALGLKPSFRRIMSKGVRLDRDGKARLAAPLFADSGLPKAAVRVTAQGTVIEDSGRPATARKSVVRHYYPYYIGSTLSGWVRRPVDGQIKMEIACVSHDGKRLETPKKLSVKIERIDSVYSYKTDARGWNTWHCERVRSDVVNGDTVTVSTNGNTFYTLPLNACGDYSVTLTDAESGVSYGRSFYLGDSGDDAVRAPLSNPMDVTIVQDKAFYRVGDTPRLIVKAPFAGKALLCVMRDRKVCSEILTLTNATSEIVLGKITADNAPNLDVSISIVQGVEANGKRLAMRAHGQTTLAVRCAENEIGTSVNGRVEIGEKGADVYVSFKAPGATEAVVTLVDEGINILTGEETPDPVAFFSRVRQAEHPLYDLYCYILPVLGDDIIKAGGIKTGGGFGAEMLSRVSPVPTRRFKPLALWKKKVPVVNGAGSTAFKLPEFAGEARVTVVAYNEKAAGAASVQLKVTPKLVMMPDAPRFAAPGDRFDAILPVFNKSGSAGKAVYAVSTNGVKVAEAEIFLAKDASTNITLRLVTDVAPGEMKIGYEARGFGEAHSSVIFLPVRPAVAWHETAGVKKLAPGEKFKPEEGRFSYREYDSPLGEFSRALEWLNYYPHGCLEQTVSRVFPLIAAGGIMAGVETAGSASRPAVVEYAVNRVESMIRENDFVMWPDADYAPWDKDVSIYASYFLIAAKNAGEKVQPRSLEKVIGFLSKWAVNTNADVSAYAVHTLAVAGNPDMDRMFRLYDERTKLSLLARARLARAFAAIGDVARARELLTNASSPASVKEAAFTVLALLETNPHDERILPLIQYLNEKRDRSKFSWGTTEDNAHALMAIGAYFRRNPPVKGEKIVVWHKLELPDIKDVKTVTNGISVARRFLTPEGEAVDVGKLKRGEMVVAEIKITSIYERDYSDLIIEDLFAAALEPTKEPFENGGLVDWILRADARDDRMMVFSKKFHLKAGESVTFRYPLRVVSSGEFVLPGVSVEAMYAPALNARTAPECLNVER